MLYPAPKCARSRNAPFAAKITAAELMEEPDHVAQAVRQFFPHPGECTVFFGNGHNGGDALVAARHLAKSGWRVHLRAAFPQDQWSALTRQQHTRIGLTDRRLEEDAGRFKFVSTPASMVVLDGLLGIGAGGVLREPSGLRRGDQPLARRERRARVSSILPTGLDANMAARTRTRWCGLHADDRLPEGRARGRQRAPLRRTSCGGAAAQNSQRSGRKRAASSPPQMRSRRSLAGGRSIRTRETADASVSLRARPDLPCRGALCGRGGTRRSGPGSPSMCPKMQPIVAAQVHRSDVHAIDSPRQVLEAVAISLALDPGLGEEHRDEVLDLIARAPPRRSSMPTPSIFSRTTSITRALRRTASAHAAPWRACTLDPDSANGPARNCGSVRCPLSPHAAA